MPWGAKEEKKEEVEPSTTERDVLVYEINEIQNDTLESTRYQDYKPDYFFSIHIKLRLTRSEVQFTN